MWQYDEKVNHIIEHEGDLEIFEEKEEDTESTNAEETCSFCEKNLETEIRLVAHIWQVHRGKLSLTIIQRRLPP